MTWFTCDRLNASNRQLLADGQHGLAENLEEMSRGEWVIVDRAYCAIHPRKFVVLTIKVVCLAADYCVDPQSTLHTTS